MKQFNLEEYLANPSRKVVTRDGENVRIVCTDKKGNDYPVVALIEWEKVEEACDYTKDGYLNDGHITDYDLFFAPEKHEGWINIFKSSNDIAFLGQSRIFESKEDAEKDGKDCDCYAATVKVEWEE